MSVLYIESGKLHKCGKEKGGVRVLNNDDLSRLKFRAGHVQLKCRGFDRKCSDSCILAQLLVRLNGVDLIEPMVRVNGKRFKLCGSGKLVTLKEDHKI